MPSNVFERRGLVHFPNVTNQIHKKAPRRKRTGASNLNFSYPLTSLDVSQPPPTGATFLVFVDYMRATIRVAALAELPTTYILTHDSIGVGEDGPTHQPVETVSSLRTFPNLDVMRPADSEETVGAYVHSATRQTGPTALILTRQAVKEQSQVSKSRA